MSKERILLSHIDQVRKLTANYRLRNSFFLFAASLLTFAVVSVYLEAVFWFGSTVRWFILVVSLTGSAISIAVALIIHYRINRGQFSGSSDEEIASIIGEHDPSIKDRLLNIRKKVKRIRLF